MAAKSRTASESDRQTDSTTDTTVLTDTNNDRGRFTFRHYWFDAAIRADWERLTGTLRGRPLQALEIGCYEGASTTWMLDNLMTHPDSTLTCIDSFCGGMEHQQTERADEYALPSLESRFHANVAKCQNFKSKLRVMKENSDDALLSLRKEKARFDFIYIDASHVAVDVLHDAVLCWRMLNQMGTLVFDDYRWKGYLEDCYNPRIAIQAFLFCVADEVETSETEYQMWVTKVAAKTKPTPNPDPEVYYWDSSFGLKLHEGDEKLYSTKNSVL